jgi:hypothetical protein
MIYLQFVQFHLGGSDQPKGFGSRQVEAMSMNEVMASFETVADEYDQGPAPLSRWWFDALGSLTDLSVLTVDAWFTDQSSHSYIALLPVEDRTQLMNELRATVLHAFPDGQMSVPYETWVRIAKRHNHMLTQRS